MTFEIRPIAEKTFRALYTPALIAELGEFLHETDNWARFAVGATWAVDAAAMAGLLQVSVKGQPHGSLCYALLVADGFALILEERPGAYRILAASQALAGRLEDVRRHSREALRTGGRFLDGATGQDALAVNTVQFLAVAAGPRRRQPASVCKARS